MNTICRINETGTLALIYDYNYHTLKTLLRSHIPFQLQDKSMDLRINVNQLLCAAERNQNVRMDKKKIENTSEFLMRCLEQR